MKKVPLVLRLWSDRAGGLPISPPELVLTDTLNHDGPKCVHMPQ